MRNHREEPRQSAKERKKERKEGRKKERKKEGKKERRKGGKKERSTRLFARRAKKRKEAREQDRGKEVVKKREKRRGRGKMEREKRAESVCGGGGSITSSNIAVGYASAHLERRLATVCGCRHVREAADSDRGSVETEKNRSRPAESAEGGGLWRPESTVCGVHERERVRRSELECGSGVVSERVWTSGLPRFRVSQCATGNRSLGAENVDTLRQFSVSRFSLSASWLLRDTRRHTRTYVYIYVCIHIYVCIYYIRSHGTQFIQ